MSSAGVPAASLSLWREYKNPEGRAYWFHTTEKRSVWEKPDELKTPREIAISRTRWKEYKSGERSYYVHSDTKETTWQMPQELQDALAQIPADGEVVDTPPHPDSQGAASPFPAHALKTERSTASASPAPAPGPAPGPPPVAPAGLALAGPPRPVYNGPPPGFGPPGPPPVLPPSAGSMPSPATAGPAPVRPPTQPPTGPAASQPQGVVMNAAALSSPQEAFKHLLRSKGVTISWTWEQTMRQIVTEPLYKALKSLAERKAVFADFQADLRKEEEEERARKRLAVKPQVIEVLKGASEKGGKLKPYASWKTVMKLCGSEPALKDAIEAVGEGDVRPFWDEVKKELAAAEEASARETRHRNMDLLMSLLRTFEADVTTRWRDAHRTVLESSEWQEDAHLSSMDLSDMITVFEEYVRDIEKEEAERRRREDKAKAREERSRRAKFRELMEQGRLEGWIHTKASWPDVYRRLEGNETLQAMLGQRGSTPLDLFFDAVDICSRSVEARTASVEKLIKASDPKWEGITEGTTWEEFLAQVQAGVKEASHDTVANAEGVAQDDAELKSVFENLQEAATRAAREARKRHERRIRHLIDDARYGLKKDIDGDLLRDAEALVAWDEGIQGRVEKLNIREWQRLDEDIADEAERAEVKKVTWEKFSRRQKEKAEERLASEAASRKRKSEMEAAHDERERERARRREDRDRRRGGRDERDRDAGAGSRRSRERVSGEDDASGDYPAHTKRRRSEGPATAVKPPAPAPISMLSSGGGDDDDDDDKEEGEV
ncbi:unnamed protein product [Parajaminaea phylloscopi]